MKPARLRTKLTVFYAALFTLLLTLTSLIFYNLLAYQMDRALRDELTERAGALKGYLHFEEGQPVLAFDPSDPEEAFFVGNATRYYQVYDARSGAMIVRSQPLAALGFQYTPDEVRDIARGGDFAVLDTDQVDVLFYNELLKSPDGQVFLVQVGAPVSSRPLGHLLRIMLWVLPCGIVIALVSGWWISRRVLRPVGLLSAAASEITISQLDRRLPLTGTGDELDQLACTFNDVFGRLEHAVAQMKQFTANISHELRTPLTALRGEAEIALARARTVADYRAVLESQLEEFGKLSKLIDQMLTLARAEAGQIQLERRNIDLSHLVASLVDQMEPVAASKCIALAAHSAGQVFLRGDAGWIERAILNLLDNAIKFTREGGRVDVRVRQGQGEAVLEVEDNGIGIAREALPHIFERFYRGDESRSKEQDGAGLGLSLVEWIVRRHHGRIGVESRPGQGATFRVMLPQA